MLKFYGAGTPDPGEWRTWREEPRVAGKPEEGTDKLEVLVRSLPPAEEKRIDAKHFGRKRQIIYGRKGIGQDLDVEAQERANLEKAAYCMLDSRGFEFEIASEQDVARLSSLLGAGGTGEVKAGAVVRFDGRWNDPLKDYVFAALPSLVEFIGTEARKMRGAAVEEDEEAAKN